MTKTKRTLAIASIVIIVLSALSIANYSAVSASSTAVFQDGFERGSLSNWSGRASAVVVQSPVHSGSYAAKASGPNSYWCKVLSTGYNNLYFGGYIQILSALPKGRTTLFLYISDISYSYAVAGCLRVDYSGNARWLLNVNRCWYPSSNSISIELGRWYFMEIKYSTSGTASLWVDDNLIASASGQALYGAARIIEGGNPTPISPTRTRALFVSNGDDYVADVIYISPSTIVPSQPPTPITPTQFGFGVYSDQTCTNKISNYGWGTLSPGASKSIIVYVRNEGAVPITLQKQMLNTNPTNLGSYLTVDWNYNGQTLNTGQVLAITLTLRVSSQIVGISNFGFDVTITASG